jgi:transcriptional regulator with XRE-family HTH domain
MALIVISDEYRRVIKETRERLRLTQRALEKRARLGSTYVSYVESGRTKSTDPAPLMRLLQTLQRQAERAVVPASVKTGLLRVLKGVERQGQGAAKR